MTSQAELLIEGVLRAIGEDVDREGLKDTPKRVTRSWAAIFGGYKLNPKEILSTKFASENYNQMVVLKDIEMYSTCEHHMLPFFGKAHVAYIPSNHGVVGLSKIARLVECYARRLQIQERLTQQIAQAMHQNLNPMGVGVMIEAQHMCMTARGVNKQNSVMVTSALHGTFKDPRVKEEFLRLIGRG